MRQRVTLRGGGLLLAVVAALSLLAESSYADALESLAAADVLTSYVYPDGGDPGVLTLNDNGVGLIATLVGGANLPLSNPVDVELSVELTGEGDNPADSFGHGLFSGGTLTMVDNSGPPVTVFQATVNDFELVEDVVLSGFFAGFGTFKNATYGGELASINLPAEGQVFTTLFSWFTGPELVNAVNIDNFLAPPGVNTTLYGEMQINVVPEPATLVFLSLGGLLALRRRR